MGVAAVLIGRIPEGKSTTISIGEKIGEPVETESGLVGFTRPSASSRSEAEVRNFDPGFSQRSFVYGFLDSGSFDIKPENVKNPIVYSDRTLVY